MKQCIIPLKACLTKIWARYPGKHPILIVKTMTIYS